MPKGLYIEATRFHNWIEELIKLATRGHDTCEDTWYNCPLSEEGCADDEKEGCTCGADEHNEKVRELAKKLGL